MTDFPILVAFFIHKIAFKYGVVLLAFLGALHQARDLRPLIVENTRLEYGHLPQVLEGQWLKVLFRNLIAALLVQWLAEAPVQADSVLEPKSFASVSVDPSQLLFQLELL